MVTKGVVFAAVAALGLLDDIGVHMQSKYTYCAKQTPTCSSRFVCTLQTEALAGHARFTVLVWKLLRKLSCKSDVPRQLLG